MSVLLFSPQLAPAAPADIQGYLGRLVRFYYDTYTVARVELSQRSVRLPNGAPFLGDARLYLVREEGNDGHPRGRWVEASAIAEPGKTILHWEYRTDYRETPEKCADLYRRATEAEEMRAVKLRQAEEARRAEEARCERIWAEITPSWAKSYLVAELCQDESDTMTDYFSFRVTKRVLLGFSKSDRNNFSEMRKAAAMFPETTHLAGPKGVEHRENYSGGSGYYLGSSLRYSGWTIRKCSLNGSLPRGGSAVIDFAHWTLKH